MFKPMMFSIAALSASFGTSLSAENYFVLLVEGGFFPGITHVVPGDTVTFVNELTIPATTQASDESWATGSLGVNASYVLPVTAETALVFAYATDASKIGQMSFDPAPLDGSDSALAIVDESLEPAPLN